MFFNILCKHFQLLFNLVLWSVVGYPFVFVNSCAYQNVIVQLNFETDPLVFYTNVIYDSSLFNVDYFDTPMIPQPSLPPELPVVLLSG